jgi:hypothetical protein
MDSLIQLPVLKKNTKLAARLGYNSNVIATSRTLGFNLYGVAPGLSYYHKSGLYADASSYYSQQYSPNFYLSVLSGGYLKTLFKHWSLLTEYSRYFYSAAKSGVYSPYTNNFGVANYFGFKPVTLRVDYYYFFGQKSANRIMPALMITLEKKKWRSLDRISFFPSFSVLYGSEWVIAGYIFYPNQSQIFQENQTRPPNAQLPYQYPDNKDVYGLMNYSFTAPLSITRKNWNVIISYTYNVPKSLPHEDLGLKNGGYISFSVARYINFQN